MPKKTSGCTKVVAIFFRSRHSHQHRGFANGRTKEAERVAAMTPEQIGSERAQPGKGQSRELGARGLLDHAETHIERSG
jgi:hypothetical protein